MSDDSEQADNKSVQEEEEPGTSKSSSFSEEVTEETVSSPSSSEKVGEEAEEQKHEEPSELRSRKQKTSQVEPHSPPSSSKATTTSSASSSATSPSSSTSSAAAEKSPSASAPSLSQRVPASFHAVKNLVTDKVTEFSKNPAQIGSMIKTHIDNRIPNKYLILFCLMWTPFWIMIGGSMAGHLISLIFKNFHFLVGIAATAYVWTLHTGKDQSITYQQKFLHMFLIASTLPIFMLDESSVILKLVTMLAFCGTPFLFSLLYDSGDKEKEDKLSWDERLLQFATASSAIFVLSTLPGDNGYFHHLFLAVIFGGAAYLANMVVPMVMARIPDKQKPQVAPHQIVVFALIETIIAHVLLLLLKITVIPQSAIDAQHGFGASLIFTLFGLVFLAGGHLLSSEFLATQLPAATVTLVTRIGLGAILASYGVLLFMFVIQHWIYTAISHSVLENLEEKASALPLT